MACFDSDMHQVDNSAIIAFNNMDINVKNTEDSPDLEKKRKELVDNLFPNACSIREYETLESGLDEALKMQAKWKTESSLHRANILHEISSFLTKKSNEFTQTELFDQNEYSLIINYFDYYSDWAFQLEDSKHWEPLGLVLVILSEDCPPYFLASIVGASLAAGCTIFAQASRQSYWFGLFLAKVFSQIGIPSNLFNLVKKPLESKIIPEKIHKVVFCGRYLEAQELYSKNLSNSFSFICPNNTTAIILESCDLSSAVDKILSETWKAKSGMSLWGVSTIVVQESISEVLLDTLKIRMNKLFVDFNDVTENLNELEVDRVNKISTEAIKAGATLLKYNIIPNKWGPLIVTQYQDEYFEADVPVIKVLICRTAAEGIMLANNCRYSLGTSIWTEITSQALEVASKLICKNIWINCHGVVEANVPNQPSGISGNFVFGGKDGFMEFVSYKFERSQIEKLIHEDTESLALEKLNSSNIVFVAQEAFKKWSHEKAKRKCLKDAARFFEKTFENLKLFEIFNYWAHNTNMCNSISSFSTQEFYVIQKKVPLGVIGIIVNSPNVDVKTIVSFITPAIALGNVIILVLKDIHSSLKVFLTDFNKFLPKNVLNVMIGPEAALNLASSPNVMALWFYDEFPKEYFHKMKNLSTRTLKNFWVFHKDLPTSVNLFEKKCLTNKILWLTKVDQFP